jgi:hypothetical protein
LPYLRGERGCGCVGVEARWCGAMLVWCRLINLRPVNQFYRREPRTNIWPDIGSRFATVKLVHRSEIYHKSSPPPRVGRLHLHRCRPTRLRLMGALSLTRRKPRGRSGLHSTPGLASTVLTRRLAPAWGIFARTVPGVVPRRCTPGFHRSPLLGFDHR